MSITYRQRSCVINWSQEAVGMESGTWKMSLYEADTSPKDHKYFPHRNKQLVLQLCSDFDPHIPLRYSLPPSHLSLVRQPRLKPRQEFSPRGQKVRYTFLTTPLSIPQVPVHIRQHGRPLRRVSPLPTPSPSHTTNILPQIRQFHRRSRPLRLRTRRNNYRRKLHLR